MNALKKSILGVVMSLSLFGPIAAVPTAQANPEMGQNQTRVYYVYYRASAHSRWVNYGGYYHHHQAHQAQRWFQFNGYESFVR